MVDSSWSILEDRHQRSQESKRLFLEDSPAPGWQLVEVADWASLRTLLETAQKTKTPLWMSKGPRPLESEGMMVRMAPDAVLPQPRLDRSSLLLHCDTRHSLETLESFARIEGLTAGFRPHPVKTLLEWIQQSYVTVMDSCSGEPVSRMVGCAALLPDGQPMRLGRAPHSAVGPDLKTLYWGTCGALGVMTRATLRLRRISSSMTFWKLRFENWASMTTFVQSIVRARQYPVDTRAELLSSSQEVTLSLRVNPLQTPLTQRLCQKHPESQELLASHFGQPRRKPLWLRLDAPWKTIGELPELIYKTSPFEVLSISLVHLTHEQGVTLVELGYRSSLEEQIPKMANWIRELQEYGVTSKADNRLLPWTTLHPYRREVLTRIKRELDPAFVLNSHLFVEN